MIFRQLFDSVSSTYTYLLGSRQGGEALLIDPVLEKTDHYLRLLSELDLTLVKAIDTHVHADHITGASELRERTGAKICYGSKTGVKGADILLEDNDCINLNSFSIKSIYTPGHTLGCTSYYVDGCIFTGDTIFID